MGYISTAEANTYLCTSGQDTLVGVVIEIATGIIDSIIGCSLVAGTVTETLEYKGNGPYYFANIPINSVTHINGTETTLVADTDYRTRGSRIMFSDTVVVDQDDTRGDVRFTYTKGYASIPQAVKDATRILVSELRGQKGAEGLTSWTQGDLSVTYNQNMNSQTRAKVSALLQGYILPRIVA